VQPPLHRAANSGFRCVRNTAALPAQATAERRQTIRNFAKAQPATTADYRISKTMYTYDRPPLNAMLEDLAQDSKHWREQKVTSMRPQNGDLISKRRKAVREVSAVS